MSTKFYIEPALRKDAIEILQIARGLIASCETAHVCYAVRDAQHTAIARGNRRAWIAGEALRVQIMASILPYTSVSGWLKDQIGSHAQYNTDMRVYRMAWINEMIAQIRAMG